MVEEKKKPVLSFRDIIRPAMAHPYQSWFTPEIIQRARCIEDQRRLAEQLQTILTMETKPSEK
jgi:hypothetical protein